MIKIVQNRRWISLGAACLLATISLLSFAADSSESLKLSWDFPTKRINGNALSVEEIDYSTVIWVCNGKEGSRTVAAPQHTTTVGVPAPGECLYYITVTDKGGLISDRSEAFEWIEKKSPPHHPENITGEINE